MRILKRFTLAAVVMLVLAAVAVPAYAACSGTALIGSRPFAAGTGPGSYIWNPGVFDVNYAPGYVYYAPFGYTAPVTADFTGFFWRLGEGDPAVGAGVDNGDDLAYRANTAYGQSGWFYYTGYPATSFYYAGRVFGNWGGADGCITDLALPTCECIMFLDQDGADGYFAIIGGRTTAGGDLAFPQPGNDGNGNAGPITLAPIPSPNIDGSVRDPATFDVTLQVSVDAPTDGTYIADGCLCGPEGWLMYQQILPRGSAPPSDRDDTGWELMTLPGDVPQPQGGNPFGAQINVESLCGASNTDVYLATGDPGIGRLEPDRFYANNGNGTFTDVTFAVGLGNVGKGHGVTFVDLDEDGDLEIYAPEGGFWHGDPFPNAFYLNKQSTGNHWLHVDLVGRESNRDGVGTRMTLVAGDLLVYKERFGGRGFGSTDSPPVEFGLGKATEIDSLELIWPSGTRQVFRDLPVDARILVEEGSDPEILSVSRDRGAARK